MRDTAAIDIIVRGEGYATAPALINALASNTPLQIIRGIAFRHFTSVDVVRHPLVQKIIDAYDRDAVKNPPSDRAPR